MPQVTLYETAQDRIDIAFASTTAQIVVYQRHIDNATWIRDPH